MKRAGLLWTSAFALAVIAGSGLTMQIIHADEPPKKEEGAGDPGKDRKGPPEGREEGRRPHGPELMRVIDTNKDGEISKEEFSKAAEKFDELDANKDGKLDPRELMGPPPRDREDGDGPRGGFRGRGGRRGGPDGPGEGGPRGRGPRGPEGDAKEGPEDGPPMGDRPGRRDGGPRDGGPRRGRFGAGQGGPGGGRMEEVLHRVFENLDGNGDGKITTEEAPAKMKEKFASIDTNSDGAIDEPELCKIGLKGRGPGREGRPPKKDKDGKGPEKPADAPETK